MVIQLFSIRTGPPLVLFLLERVGHSRICLRDMNFWQVIQKISTTQTTSIFLYHQDPGAILLFKSILFSLHKLFTTIIRLFSLAWLSHSELATFSQIPLFGIVRKHLEQQKSTQLKISCKVYYKKLATKRIKISKFVNNLHFINHRKCVTFLLLELKHFLDPERKEISCRALEKSVECVCIWLHLRAFREK